MLYTKTNLGKKDLVPAAYRASTQFSWIYLQGCLSGMGRNNKIGTGGLTNHVEILREMLSCVIMCIPLICILSQKTAWAGLVRDSGPNGNRLRC